MNFKYPEILYFLFLLVIPILVHLFQLRRFQEQYFTNVRFLKNLSIMTRKSSKLKKWLLLTTRLLALTFLIIAFAQPYFNTKNEAQIDPGLFIILDNSFSMQAKGKKGILLKRAIQDLLENVPEDQPFSLLTNSDAYWDTDIKSIQKELQNIKYTACPFYLDQILTRIASKKTSQNKNFIIITDAIDLNQKQLERIDSTTNAYFIIPKAENKNNIAIDHVSLSQVLDHFYEIKINLISYGTNNPSAVPIALYNQDKLIAKTQIDFHTKTAEVFFTIPKDNFHGYASITDNALEYDNQFFFTISKPKKTNIIAINENATDAFLSKIYSAEEFNYQSFSPKTLNYNLLEDQDVIVLHELKDIPINLQTTLNDFIEKGGVVILIPAMESSITMLNHFTAQLGSLRFEHFEKTEKLITKIAFDHPLYQGVFEKKATNFQYPKTLGSFVLKSTVPQILTYEDQSPFLIEISKGASHIYVFAAPINKSNSNFQNAPLIVPTFYNMAQNQSNIGIQTITIGNNTPYFVNAALSKDEIIKIGNKNENFIPAQRLVNKKVKVSFNDFPLEAGNFSIYKQDEMIAPISFNYNRTQSDLTPNHDRLLSHYKILDTVKNAFDTIHTTQTAPEIWRRFLFLTLLFLLTEIVIQKIIK